MSEPKKPKASAYTTPLKVCPKSNEDGTPNTSGCPVMQGTSADPFAVLAQAGGIDPSNGACPFMGVIAQRGPKIPEGTKIVPGEAWAKVQAEMDRQKANANSKTLGELWGMATATIQSTASSLLGLQWLRKSGGKNESDTKNATKKSWKKDKDSLTPEQRDELWADIVEICVALITCRVCRRRLFGKKLTEAERIKKLADKYAHVKGKEADMFPEKKNKKKDDSSDDE